MGEPDVDGTGPRVIASSVVRDSVVSWGTFVYTARFDEELNASVLDASDVELVGGHSGTHEPAWFHYSPMTSTLTVAYAHLPDDVYTLSLHSGDTGFEDLAGNDLDGEPDPATTIPSGDGTAGGDFVVTFSADGDLFRYPGPLEAKPPWGSLIYDPMASGFIETAQPKDSTDRGGKSVDTDGWTIELDAGQTITLVIFASETFQPTVEIFDPTGKTIGSATAVAPGQRALLQTLPATIDGTYTIEVGAMPGSGGLYMVQLILNAAVEVEEQGGPSNDDPATAQDLDATFLTLGDGPGERGAVLGSLPMAFGPEIASEDFESGEGLPPGWSTSSQRPEGRIQVTDAYGAAEGSYALLMDCTNGEGNLNEAIWRVDLSGHTEALLSFYHAEWNDEEDPLPGNFPVRTPGDGVSISSERTEYRTWHSIFSPENQPSGVWRQYVVDLADEANKAGLELGSQFRIKFQQNDNNPLPNDGRGYDGIRITEPADGEDDWYRFTLNDGQSATMVLTTLHATIPGEVTLELYDDRQNLLAVGLPSDGADQVVSNFVDHTWDAGPDTYYLHVTGDPGRDYSLVVSRDADFETYDWHVDAQDITSSGIVLGHTLHAPGYGDSINESQKVVASDAEPGDHFGGAVSISGNTALVGANGDDDLGNGSGAAYIYRFDGVQWTEQQKLVASDAGGGTNFGSSVFIDGETAIVGALYSDGKFGSAYIYRFDGSRWIEQQKLQAPDGELGDYFGRGVALSGDTAIIGNHSLHAPWIFRFDGSVWIEQHKLVTNDPAVEEYFGRSIAIVDDTALVGARRTDETGASVGVVYVFQFDGNQWVEQQMLTAPDSPIAANFGRHLVLSGDMAIVGALGSAPTGEFRGAAYVFRLDGNTFKQEAKLTAWDVSNTLRASFGRYVSLSGNRAVVGADIDQYSEQRMTATYLFEFDGERWIEKSKLVISDPSFARNPFHPVGISGETVLVGVSVDDAGGNNAGAVYLADWPPPEDRYAFGVEAGNRLTIATTTPGDGPREFFNRLDPRLDLYDPLGTLVAEDDNGAADGRNALLTHTATTTGTYTVQVRAAEETSGEYVLKVSGQSGALPPMHVTASDPANGAQLSTAPERVTVHFSQAVLLTTLDASDLAVDGVPATGVTVVDGKTAVFDLPVELASGMHSLTVPAGAVLDLQGTPLDAFSADFTLHLSHVAGRHVFYNNSTFDGNNQAADVQDDAARAYNKVALMPGRTARFANYTSYAKGLNGIMVDIAGPRDLAKLNAAEDFVFKVGNGSDPSGWADAPDPLSMTIRQDEGVGGSDRVTIIWPDNAIEKQWLQVTVRATENTGLAQPDVFYFGNAPGEAGDSAINTIVNATDEIVARNFQHSAVDPARIDDQYDYNRDGLVNGTDQTIARAHQTNPLTMLRLITAPVADAVVKQAAELESLSPMISLAKLDWLHEFEQMSTIRQTSKKSSPAEEAVDELLAGYW
ncbi:MAG: pre-peptidase C-terminal domain-containing protein [Thermoguttaceae bacterium]